MLSCKKEKEYFRGLPGVVEVALQFILYGFYEKDGYQVGVYMGTQAYICCFRHFLMVWEKFHWFQQVLNQTLGQNATSINGFFTVSQDFLN